MRCIVLSVTLAIAVLMTGCASSAPTPPSHIPHSDDAEKVAAYQARIKQLVSVVDDTPGYKRIPLDSDEEIGWFAGLSFQFWDGQITRDEFMKRGLARFPGYEASFRLVAENLLN